ncbi:MAG: hypothetical protein IKE43_08410 [Coriobacteriales bacterium]|nr:hypothetical protein [Coriobacteriales bacterium]
MEDSIQEQILKRLLLAHQSWYDITENSSCEGRMFRARADFHSYGEKYVLSKRAKLWEINSHDHMFFDVVDKLDEAALSDYIEFLTHEGLSIVGPQTDQMANNLTLVLIAGSLDEDACKLLKKTRFRKNYRFGLQGWTDLRLAAIDISNKRVITNAAARDMKTTLIGNAKFN